MKITKEVLYEALTLAARHIEGNNDKGCSECPVDEKSCGQTPFKYCVTNIVKDYIEFGVELVEAKKTYVGK